MAMVRVGEELEPKIRDSDFLKDAPFGCVHLILKLGSDWKQVKIGRVDRLNSELEVSIEVPMAAISRKSDEEMYAIVKRATYTSLHEVARRYGLNTEVWASWDGSSPSEVLP